MGLIVVLAVGRTAGIFSGIGETGSAIMLVFDANRFTHQGKMG